MLKGVNGVPTQINGDTVIGFTNSQKIKDLKWTDMASLSAWYRDDPNKNHLGMIELFSNATDYSMPFYKDLFKSQAIIEVNGMGGKFTYDLPVTKPTGCYIAKDTSTYSETPGIDGSVFPIYPDQQFEPGDVLTYDVQHGEQLVISEDYPVTQEGDTWKHWAKFVAQSAAGYFPSEKLKTGIQYFKVGHVLGEYSTQFSSIQTPDNTGTIKLEFVLGNHRGVETYTTMYANMKSMSGASQQSKSWWDYFVTEKEKLGTDSLGRELDMFYVAKLNGNGKIANNSVRIGSAMEYLCLLELMKIENHQLMFQKGGIIRDINGTKRLNEGVYHQWRRGRIIQYARPGGINRSHLKEAAAYIFKGRGDMQPNQREMTWDCGSMAYTNMETIFREEFLHQLEILSPLMGTDRVLPSNPVSGSLNSLEIEPIMIKGVYLPEIGRVRIRREPALDYQPLTDRREAGFYGNGHAWTSYSMIIRDAASSQYSNARVNLPSNVKLVDEGPKTADVYYVKPQGETLHWGYENGRYSPDKAAGVVSSAKRMGYAFWAHSTSAAWVPDPSRTITIELRR